MSNINIFSYNQVQDIYSKKGQRAQALKITETIKAAIDRSWLTRPCRHQTKAEEDRRFKICFGFILTVCEHGEPVDFALDHMFPALEIILDGGELELQDNALYQVRDSGLTLRVKEDKIQETLIND